MRKAFSMVTAIVVIVMMATIAILVLDTANKITTETTAQYRHEQSMLLAKSYTEFAILAIQESNMTSGAPNTCLRTITANINSLNGIANANGVAKGEGYYVEVKIQYIGLAASINCGAVVSGFGSLGNLATSTSSDVSAMIDVYVQYHDLDVVAKLGGTAISTDPWVTYHRRTLQRL
jgi:hypothetical protein